MPRYFFFFFLLLNITSCEFHFKFCVCSQAKFECALKHPSIKIITPDWITDSVKDKTRKEETLYHPRLTYVEPEEDDEEESEEESYDQRSRSDGSYSSRRSRQSSGASSRDESPAASPRRRPGPRKLHSPNRKPERRGERMFDDSDDDSSTEREGRNLNWTPAEVVTPTAAVATNTARRRTGPPGKDPTPTSGTGLINLCATVPPVPGNGGPVTPEARPASQGPAGQQGQFNQGNWYYCSVGVLNWVVKEIQVRTQKSQLPLPTMADKTCTAQTLKPSSVCRLTLI